MNQIEKLIQQYCPEGVEYKKLKEIGHFYGGLTGKNKADFGEGNSRYISYMDVFSNIHLNNEIKNFVRIDDSEKQNKVRLGDILFTGSSETIEECGMSSVVTTKFAENTYLNSFCFGLHLRNNEILLPGFTKYLFRSFPIRKQIVGTANGVTRFNVSKKRFEEICIPVPPLPVQEAIVSILDKFTSLEAELEAELEARRAQYDYYRNQLLTPIKVKDKWMLNGVEVEWKKIKEICFYPKERLSYKELTANSYVGVDNLLPNRGGKTNTNYLPTSGNMIQFLTGDVLIGNIRPYLKKIWKADLNGGTNGDVIVIRIIEDFVHLLTPEYLYYLLSLDNFFEYDMRFAKGGKMPRGDKNSILEYPIPIPPLSEQKRIISILDKFDALVNDISIGLPAEQEARRKQYEYYRERLLTFKELRVES